MNESVNCGWKKGKLGDYGEFKNGINYSRNEKGDTEYSILNVRDIVESKYDSQCSITECVTEYNECHECNICRKPMCTSHSHYINKKHKETPIICYKCINDYSWSRVLIIYESTSKCI